MGAIAEKEKQRAGLAQLATSERWTNFHDSTSEGRNLHHINLFFIRSFVGWLPLLLLVGSHHGLFLIHPRLLKDSIRRANELLLTRELLDD